MLWFKQLESKFIMAGVTQDSKNLLIDQEAFPGSQVITDVQNPNKISHCVGTVISLGTKLKNKQLTKGKLICASLTNFHGFQPTTMSPVYS